MELTKNKKLLLIAISAFLVCIISTVSYAYFTAIVSGNEQAQTTVIQTGHMEVTYQEGNVIGATQNMVPGDHIDKPFTVTNTGTVDTFYSIYLNDITNTFITKSDLVYELITEDGRVVNQTTCPTSSGVIASNIAIAVNETHHYTLRLTFKETSINQDDNKGKTFTAKIDLEEEVPPYTVLFGDLDTVGSEVKIANEEFYVIGQEDSTHVKLLSKWNLNVGSSPKGTATNLQDSEVRGYVNGSNTAYGSVKFSNINYWYDGSSLKAEYGTNYPAYVYTNNKENDSYVASIAEYIDNYVDYLNNQRISVTGRLIKQEELVILGCDVSAMICTNAPSWVYQTSYWTGTAFDDNTVMRVATDKYFFHNDHSHYFGVRPVIILEK